MLIDLRGMRGALAEQLEGGVGVLELVLSVVRLAPPQQRGHVPGGCVAKAT